jgi:histone H3/H4
VGARSIARPPAVPKGKDIGMALFYGKSSFYPTSILLWLSVSLAGQMLCPLRIVAQTATTLSSQGVSPKRIADEQTISKIASQPDSEAQSNEGPSQASLPGKQKRDLMKANFEKLKRDAGELAGLAKDLQEELNRSNENMLSLHVVEKADKIQKLAKRIKGNARGF